VGIGLDSLWKSVKDAIKVGGELATTVVTAGGSNAIAKNAAAYEIERLKHTESENAFSSAETEFKEAVDQLGLETANCMKLLREAADLVDRLSYSAMQSAMPTLSGFKAPDIATVSKTIAEFNAAVVAGQGTGLGIGVSTGAWILVAHFGTASTGTAIAGLTGAAAHSAILAWFGGGAVLAGGGGMAVGSLAIGGIVALPVLAFSAYKSYKEASRIETERARVVAASERNIEGIRHLRRLKSAITALREDFVQKRSDFAAEYGAIREDASQLAFRLAAFANSFATFMTAKSLESGGF
jgi:hypothetical protein